MTGWLIALLLIVLFLCMRVGVYVRWEREGSDMKIRLGFLRLSLPFGKRKETEKPKRPPSKPADSPDKQKRGMSPRMKQWLAALWENRQALMALLGKMMKSPTLDLLRLHVDVGNADPAACALTYGRICAGISAALPVLHNTFRVRKQDINVSCRYDLPDTVIRTEAEATVRIYVIFALTGAALGLLLKLYRSTKTMEKAVQNV